MMRRLRPLLCISALALAAGACKTGSSGGAGVKDQTDATDIQPEAGNRFFVVCRDGRLQGGQKQNHVTQDQLAHVCEEVDPGSSSNPPPVVAGSPDLSICSNVPDNVRTVNMGFTPAFAAQLDKMTQDRNAKNPSVTVDQFRVQILCEDTVVGLKNAFDRFPDLLKFLNGTQTGTHTMVVLDVLGNNIVYDNDAHVVTVPFRLTDASVARVKTEIETKVCRAGNGNGRFVDGICWYMSPAGLDCDQTCTKLDKFYHEDTKTFAGSAGTQANCTLVGTAFGFSAGLDKRCPNGINGCMQDAGRTVTRCVNFETTPTGNLPGFRRYCACK
jgi:hypothetical protein